MPREIKRILIMAGGTGGHVFPGLALANFLREKNISVAWLGTALGIENDVVPQAGIKLHLITITGVRGKGMLSLFLAPFRIARAFLQARKIIQTFKPDVVLGMGGFVSGPGGIATWAARTPLIIHEQNAKAGTTNRILKLFARFTLQAFPKTFKESAKVITVGNPIRTEITNLPAPQQRAKHASFNLLVLGGSLGARAINQLVPLALTLLPVEARPCVWHQTGNKHIDETKQCYAAAGLALDDQTIRIQPFIKHMGEAYLWADMVLCRAGALTVSELCAAGLGALLVPYPYAIDDHQTANAQYMVHNNAAVCIQENELSKERLADWIREFSSEQKRIAMAKAAFELRKTDVVNHIYELILTLARPKSL